jgi:pimeloyl-ACP methyl ester carboxylesterase
MIPDPNNSLDWDRFQYVRSNPLRYNDPTGHDVGCPGQDAGQCPPKPVKPKTQTQAGMILLVCGATGSSINASGEDCGIQGSNGDLTGWGAAMQEQYPGYTPIYVPYPGTKAGQQADIEKIIEKHPGAPVVVVGFSAGGDTSVVVADYLHNAGTQVNAVILLDPPFGAESLGMPENSDFDEVVQGLVISNGADDPAVPIFVADAFGGSNTAPLSVSLTDTAFYQYKSYPGMDHYPVISHPDVLNDIYNFFGWPR